MVASENALYPAVPLDAGQIRGWKEIPIKDVGGLDPLVALGPLSPEAAAVATSSIYFGEHSNSPYVSSKNKLDGSLLTLFARRSTARRLVAAEQLLPAGHHLIVFDAYRPYQVQKSLYDLYRQKLAQKRPDMDDEMLELETQKYVSLPSQDPTRPSPHSTGGVVDLAIVKLGPTHEKELRRLRGRLADTGLEMAQRVGLEMRLSAIMGRHSTMLDFGTAFDHGGEKSALTYYEHKIAAGEILTDDDMRACNNRRLLFKVMTAAGFQAYSPEWWHFDAPESQWGAAAAGRPLATFGAANLDEANIEHENLRLEVRRHMLRLQKKRASDIPHVTLHAEILAALPETGDPRTSGKWPAEIIAPAE